MIFDDLSKQILCAVGALLSVIDEMQIFKPRLMYGVKQSGSPAYFHYRYSAISNNIEYQEYATAIKRRPSESSKVYIEFSRAPMRATLLGYSLLGALTALRRVLRYGGGVVQRSDSQTR